MKTIPLPLLRITHAVGLVRNAQVIKLCEHRRRMRWAIKVRFLGRWWLAGRDPVSSPWIVHKASHLVPQPLLFAHAAGARALMKQLDL